MPLPFAAFSPLIGSGINALTSVFTNSAQKRQNLEMYDRQRVDALADWNRQNLYNSPAEQMKRYKEAGLNPHLIYGQTQTAQPIRSVDAKPANFNAPQVDPNTLNIPLLQQQLENMKKQGALMDAQAIKTNSETQWRNLNTKFLDETFGTRSSILENQRALLDSKQFTENQRWKQVVAQTENIIANTDLTTAKKAALAQEVKNMQQTYQLLGERILTEKQQNEFVKKVQSFGTGANVAINLLRLIMGKK